MGTQLHKRYSDRESTKQAGQFVDALKDISQSGFSNPLGNNTPEEQGILDSAAAISESLSGGDSLNLPVGFKQFFGEVSATDRVIIAGGILDSIAQYEAAHGQAVPPDLMEAASNLLGSFTQQGIHDSLSQGGIMSITPSQYNQFLDDATTSSPDGGSLQANRAVVAVQNLLTTALPWGGYLPSDINSGEAKLIIVNHQAGSTFGQYAEDASIDGANSGKRFFDARRTHTVTGDGTTANLTGQLTTIQATSETCATVGSGATAAKLVKGSTSVYIQGHKVAKVAIDNEATSQSISGSVVLTSTTYTLSGTISADTGAFTLTSSPVLPLGIDAVIESFIDYNRQPEVIPTLKLSANKFSLYARPFRGFMQVGIESLMQIRQEAGIDPLTELNRTLQVQVGNGKHYRALEYARRLAKNNSYPAWNMSTWLDSGAQTRSQNMADISIPLMAVSQQMAIDTNVTGVTHLYVGKVVAAWLQTLVMGGRFVPSGLRNVPQIFRLGRLDGLYEVYYSPDQTETTDGSGITTAKILCVGQSGDVARSGIILGTAIAPIMLPIGNTFDLKQGVGYMEKTFIEPNPHLPSSKAFAEITLTGLK